MNGDGVLSIRQEGKQLPAIIMLWAIFPMVLPQYLIPMAGALTMCLVNSLSPFQYNEVSDFTHGIAVVTKNNFFGLINSTGQEILPCKYQNSRFTSLEASALENAIAEGYLTAHSEDGWAMIAITP